MTERFERFTLSISEVSRYWHKITTKEMAKYELKGIHSMYLLTMLHYPNGITAPQICALCGRDKADVSRMMTILEEKGMVTKEGTNQNMYRGTFKLTEKGKEAAEYVRARVTLAVEIAGKELSNEKRAIFYETLEMITENLRRLSEDGLPGE